MQKSDIVIVAEEPATDSWHKRLGHVTERGLKILAEKNLLPVIKSTEFKFCEHCIMGTQKRVSFLRNNSKRDTKILDLVHSDVCGPFNIKSLGGAAYFVTFIDDVPKKVWAFPIKSKDQVLDVFQKFHIAVERETNKLLRCIRTDNGGEYCSKAFE